MCTNWFVLSISFYSNTLTVGAFLIPERLRIAPLKANQFQRKVEIFLWVPLSNTNQPVQSLCPNHIPYWAHTMHHFPHPTHLRARNHLTRDSPIHRVCSKFSKLADLKPAYPASLVLSYGNHNKISCLGFPLILSASWPTEILCQVAPIKGCAPFS